MGRSDTDAVKTITFQFWSLKIRILEIISKLSMGTVAEVKLQNSGSAMRVDPGSEWDHVDFSDWQKGWVE